MERSTILSTVLQVLTLLVSFISAIGAMTVNSKVDRLAGQVQALQALLVTHVTSPGIHSD